jgi:hypothetical protein
LAWGGGCGLDSTVSGQGPVSGCCECGDEPSGSCATELFILDVDYTICITCIMYQQLWGYIVEEKLYLGLREQKRLNTTGLYELGL